MRSWHPLTVTPACDAQTWRVRPWIRTGAVLAIIGIAAVWFDVIRRARLGETPVGEIRNGYLVLGAISLVMWLLAFRPNVRLDGSGQVVVTNPIRTSTFETADVVDIYLTPYGLSFHLKNGSDPWTIVFQATWYINEPRWFDLAEAITGTRPTVEDEFDSDD